MKKTQKLTGEQKSEVLVWACQDGMTLAKLSKMVLAKFNVEYSVSSLSNFLAAKKQERSLQTKTVIRENIGQYIVSDLDMLKKKKDQLFELSEQQLIEKDMGNYYKSIVQFKEYAKLTFELAGASEKTTETLAQQAREELLSEVRASTRGDYVGKVKSKTRLSEFQDITKQMAEENEAIREEVDDQATSDLYSKVYKN